jgi:hypothetical protein
MGNNKTYRAKQDLPGCKKGRIITSDGVNYFYDDDKSKCMYDCAGESRFFEEVRPPKYPKGTEVILKQVGSYPTCTPTGEKLRRQFELPAFTIFTIEGERNINSKDRLILKFNENYYLVSESVVSKPEMYFYVSSSGIVHKCHAGRDEKADKFRKSVGNYHTSKHDANTYMTVLKERFLEDEKLKN